jgi:hypothetical protein
MTGVNSLVFWGTSFLWDFFLMVVAIIVIVLCFPAFQSYGAYTSNGGGSKWPNIESTARESLIFYPIF